MVPGTLGADGVPLSAPHSDKRCGDSRHAEWAGDEPNKEGRALSDGRSSFETGAGDEIRTRDPYLGKVMLYH